MNRSVEYTLSLVHQLNRVKRMLKMNSQGILIMYWISHLMSSNVENSKLYQAGQHLDNYHFSLIQFMG